MYGKHIHRRTRNRQDHPESCVNFFPPCAFPKQRVRLHICAAGHPKAWTCCLWQRSAAQACSLLDVFLAVADECDGTEPLLEDLLTDARDTEPVPARACRALVQGSALASPSLPSAQAPLAAGKGSQQKSFPSSRHGGTSRLSPTHGGIRMSLRENQIGCFRAIFEKCKISFTHAHKSYMHSNHPSIPHTAAHKERLPKRLRHMVCSVSTQQAPAVGTETGRTDCFSRNSIPVCMHAVIPILSDSLSTGQAAERHPYPYLIFFSLAFFWSSVALKLAGLRGVHRRVFVYRLEPLQVLHVLFLGCDAWC